MSTTTRNIHHTYIHVYIYIYSHDIIYITLHCYTSQHIYIHIHIHIGTDTDIYTYTYSAHADVVQQVTRLLLRHEMQIPNLQPDTRLHLYLRNGAQSFLPDLYGIATEWSRLQQEEPGKIVNPLRVVLLQAVLQEMKTIIKLVIAKEASKKNALDLKWINAEEAWSYMKWNSQESRLEMDENTHSDHRTPEESDEPGADGEPGYHSSLCLQPHAGRRTADGLGPLRLGAGAQGGERRQVEGFPTPYQLLRAPPTAGMSAQGSPKPFRASQPAAGGTGMMFLLATGTGYQRWPQPEDFACQSGTVGGIA